MQPKHRSVLWRVAMVATFVVLLFPNPQAADAAVRVRYSIGDGVTATDESYVREGISLAEEYIDTFLSGAIEDNLKVTIRNEEHPENPLILAFASEDDLTIFTGSSYWASLSPALRMQVVIHEYVHIYQRDSRMDASPMWMIEGAAEYVAYSALEDAGLLNESDVTDYQNWAIVNGGDAPALDDLESVDEFQGADGPVYSLGHLAMMQLLGNAPSERLTAYLDAVDDGTRWRRAFEDSFGLQVGDFYSEFSDWRATEVDAPISLPTAFREVVGRDRDAAVTILSGPESELERGAQTIVIAETERSSNCRFDLRDDGGARLATLRTVADRTGLVFWVITIPADAPLGRSEIVANCGGDRDRLRFDVLDN